MLGRDRLGIKPLYLSRRRRARLRFASSLPALLAGGGVDTDVDPRRAAPLHELPLGGPRAAHDPAGVRKLPAGDGPHDRARRRHQRPRPTGRPSSRATGDRGRPSEWARTRCSTRCAPPSSGAWSPTCRSGCCSRAASTPALIVALLAEAGQQGLQTFSIGFEAVGGERATSSTTPTSSPKHFDTDHHKIHVDPSAAAAGRRRRRRGDERADGQPRRRRLLPALPRRSRRRSRWCSRARARTRSSRGYDWYPPLAEVAARRRARRLPRRSSTARTPSVAQLLKPEALARRRRQPRVRRRALRPAGGRHRGGRRAAPRHHDHARRRPGEAGRQHDDGVGPRGPRAVPRPRVRRAGGRLPAGAASSPHGGKGVLKEAARGVLPDEVIDRKKGYFPVPAIRHLRARSWSGCGTR